MANIKGNIREVEIIFKADTNIKYRICYQGIYFHSCYSASKKINQIELKFKEIRVESLTSDSKNISIIKNENKQNEGFFPRRFEEKSIVKKVILITNINYSFENDSKSLKFEKIDLEFAPEDLTILGNLYTPIRFARYLKPTKEKTKKTAKKPNPGSKFNLEFGFFRTRFEIAKSDSASSTARIEFKMKNLLVIVSNNSTIIDFKKAKAVYLPFNSYRVPIIKIKNKNLDKTGNGKDKYKLIVISNENHEHYEDKLLVKNNKGKIDFQNIQIKGGKNIEHVSKIKDLFANISNRILKKTKNQKIMKVEKTFDIKAVEKNITFKNCLIAIDTPEIFKYRFEINLDIFTEKVIFENKEKPIFKLKVVSEELLLKRKDFYQPTGILAHLKFSYKNKNSKKLKVRIQFFHLDIDPNLLNGTISFINKVSSLNLSQSPEKSFGSLNATLGESYPKLSTNKDLFNIMRISENHKKEKIFKESEKPLKFDIKIGLISFNLVYYYKKQASRKFEKFKLLFIQFRDLTLKTEGAIKANISIWPSYGYEALDYNNKVVVKLRGNHASKEVKLFLEELKLNLRIDDFRMLQSFIDNKIEYFLIDEKYFVKIINKTEHKKILINGCLELDKKDSMIFPRQIANELFVKVSNFAKEKSIESFIRESEIFAFHLDDSTILTKSHKSTKFLILNSSSLLCISPVNLFTQDPKSDKKTYLKKHIYGYEKHLEEISNLIWDDLDYTKAVSTILENIEKEIVINTDIVNLENLHDEEGKLETKIVSFKETRLKVTFLKGVLRRYTLVEIKDTEYSIAILFSQNFLRLPKEIMPKNYLLPLQSDCDSIVSQISSYWPWKDQDSVYPYITENNMINPSLHILDLVSKLLILNRSDEGISEPYIPSQSSKFYLAKDIRLKLQFVGGGRVELDLSEVFQNKTFRYKSYLIHINRGHGKLTPLMFYFEKSESHHIELTVFNFLILHNPLNFELNYIWSTKNINSKICKVKNRTSLVVLNKDELKMPKEFKNKIEVSNYFKEYIQNLILVYKLTSNENNLKITGYKYIRLNHLVNHPILCSGCPCLAKIVLLRTFYISIFFTNPDLSKFGKLLIIKNIRFCYLIDPEIYELAKSQDNITELKQNILILENEKVSNDEEKFSFSLCGNLKANLYIGPKEKVCRVELNGFKIKNTSVGKILNWKTELDFFIVKVF